MTDKPLHEWRVGDYVADMHYGIERLKEQFDVVSHTRWDEPLGPNPPDGDGYPQHSFFRYLEEFGGMYCNKYLRVIGYDDKSTLTNPIIICGYCYDGRRSGIVVLKEKKNAV